VSSRHAALGLTVALLAVAIGYIALLLTRPFDGGVTSVDPAMWRGAGVGVLDVAAGPLREGDRVLAIDGVDLDGWPGARLAPGASHRYEVLRGRETIDVAIIPGRYDPWPLLRPHLGILGLCVVMVEMALFLLIRRPGEPAVTAFVLLAGGMFASAVAFSMGLPPIALAQGGALPWLFLASAEVGYAAGWCGLVAFGLTFPEPFRLVTRRPWALVAVILVLPALVASLLLSARFADDPSARVATTIALASPIGIVAMLATLALNVWRWRRVVDPVPRQQLRWIASGVSLALILTLAIWELPEVLLGEPLLPWELAPVGGLPVLLGLVVALLRYRLFDLDLVIHSTLRYGVLLACIAALYVATVTATTRLVARVTDVQLALIASGVVAIAIGPLHGLLQRGANQIVYGDRDDPYRALARLGHSLEASLEHGGILAGVAVAVARALKSPFVAIELECDGTSTRVAEIGEERRGMVFPLLYRGQHVGNMIVAPRSPGEPFGRADLRLLGDFARQIGTAAQAESLTRALQRSREQLVLAREEERSRIRRDLHDGLGPSLSAVALQIETARRTLVDNPGAADRRLAQAAADARALVADIRRISRELRPPMLDAFGLVAALRRQVVVDPSDAGGPVVELNAEGAFDRLPAAVELAIYRIAVEAVQNAIQHADASHIRIDLRSDTAGVEIEVRDDGRGLPDDVEPGVGIVSMRERAAELGGSCVVARVPGGGSRVLARIPVEVTP
jgi:signal transduction histidine kinase